jgi:GNAT superfamily N-acetyltransferase
MQRLESREALLESIGQVSRQAKEFTTSFFAAPQQIQGWIDRGVLFQVPRRECVLILRRSRDCSYVYHVAQSNESLARTLAMLNGGTTWVAELVGRAEDTSGNARVYERQGFVERSTLFRMARTNEGSSSDTVNDAQVVFAQRADLDDVAEFFSQLLDPLVDHIPEKRDLELAIAAQQVLIVRRGGGVGGALIFETTGATSHLRYWYVRESLRGRGIGAQLQQKFLSLCRASRRIILWVARGNTGAIAKYEHYGFHKEEIADRIMVKRGTSQTLQNAAL